MCKTWACWRWCLVLVSESGTTKNAQQSVHLTLGILRQSQAVSHALSFFWLDGFAVPAPAQVTQIEWLKKDGHLEESQNLGTAMVAGATGSEILGDIMLALKSMKGKYSPELRKEINECLGFALNHRKILRLDGR